MFDGRNFSCHSLLAALTMALATPSIASAQGPIQKGNVKAMISDFAVIPDTGTGPSAPPRINLMTVDPSGRLFANDQRGKLFRISSNGSSVTEFMDIDSFTGMDVRTSSGEQGFQSFAFHPDFNQTGTSGFGKLYTIHSSNNNSTTPDFNPGGDNVFHSVLNEWTVGDPTSDTYSGGGGTAPREVIRFQQPFGNHNAGQLAFNPTAGIGPDRGNLYIGMGDGGSGGDPQENGQDTANPYGAILRINPLATNTDKYGIVAENIFASDPNPDTLGEIYAYGFRNPQRFSWDSSNGEMYIADIGQNTFEEIDRGINGGNFGWDQREGTGQFEGVKTPDMVDPIAQYNHSNSIANPSTGSRAVTIGDMVRNSNDPALNGLLTFGDFPNGKIFYLDVDSDLFDPNGLNEIFELDLVNSLGDSVDFLDLVNQTRNARGLGNSSRADLRFSFAVDGQLFVTNKHDGTIRRIVGVPEPGAGLVLIAGLTIAVIRRHKKTQPS